ncbi:hypothetical protein MAR_018637 [Mya arenaria]|uniref:Uncharacterized protein n=2 Tax=Mya arenaria TaxID=6604 RepID=A0ABY7EI16_MYAAR|nr:uncharacterized protein LOC128238647 isoform X2 [Mya arenaria]WAR08679.1 hypothetical protein MAR_018637 [Mya arenaria]
MGCCQSDQHKQNARYGRLKNDCEDVVTCNYQSILTNASQEHIEDLEQYRNTFEESLEEIKGLDYDKTLINKLIESNTKIVTLFLHEQYKLKIKMLTLEKDQLRACIKPLEHQLKACLFFNDKDDYMVDDDADDDNGEVTALRETNAETAYPRQNVRHSEGDQIANEETEIKRIETEQENDPRYQSELLFGKVIDQLVEEKHLLDERYAQIERKLDESSDNKVEIERLKCMKDELYRRSKMKEEELEDVKKDKTSF